MKNFISLIIIIFSINYCFSQSDNILLLNGKIIENIKIEDSDNIRLINYLYKDKLKLINKKEVFSYNRDKVETVLYERDTLNENFFTQEEMRSYIKGEQIARQYFHRPLVAPLGFIYGAILASGEASVSPFLGMIAAPLSYTVFSMIGQPKISKRAKFEAGLRSNELFVEGYTSYAQNKKIKNAVLGTVIGVLSGYAFSQIKAAQN